MSNETESSRPRYFRLLEKGEEKQKGDLVPNSDYKLMPTREYGEHGNGTTTREDEVVLRPVQVDEWQSYAERKPTKEDFEPTGKIECIQRNSWFATFIWSDQQQFDDRNSLDILHWRRITPPQSAKPKSIELEVRDCSGGPVQATPLSNGNIRLRDGTEVHSDTFDRLVSLRQEVMSK